LYPGTDMTTGLVWIYCAAIEMISA
jgi:hypothetical protein